jgi:hypothetical protein
VIAVGRWLEMGTDLMASILAVDKGKRGDHLLELAEEKLPEDELYEIHEVIGADDFPYRHLKMLLGLKEFAPDACELILGSVDDLLVMDVVVRYGTNLYKMPYYPSSGYKDEPVSYVDLAMIKKVQSSEITNIIDQATASLARIRELFVV